MAQNVQNNVTLPWESLTRYTRVYRQGVGELVRRYVLPDAYASQDIAYVFGDYIVGDAYVDFMLKPYF